MAKNTATVWKYALTEQQRRTLEMSLKFLHREYDTRIKTGVNSFDVAACEIARADLQDLLEIFGS